MSGTNIQLKKKNYQNRNKIIVLLSLLKFSDYILHTLKMKPILACERVRYFLRPSSED